MVRLTIRLDRDMDFVQIKTFGCLHGTAQPCLGLPVVGRGGCYVEVKDASTQMFSVR